MSKPIPDMTGKDFHVEFPFLVPAGKYTLDTRPPALEFYAQVKTMVYPKDRVVLDLNVAERLVRDSKPTFVVVVRLTERPEYGQAVSTRDIALIHMHDDRLSRVLKRLRQLHVRRTFVLSNKTISFRLHRDDLMDFNPKLFREKIEGLIGNSMLEYASRKNHQLAQVGYGSDRYRLNIQFDDLPYETFIDGLLGLCELPAARVEYSEQRFGIEIRLDEHSVVGRSLLKITPRPASACSCTVQGQISDNSATLNGELFLPGSLTSSDPGYKFLIRTDLIDILAEKNGISITLPSNRNAEAHSLETFLSAYRFIDLISSECCSFKISTREFTSGNSKINCVEFEDSNFFRAMLPILSAGISLLKEANSVDRPVFIKDIIGQRHKIVEVSAMFSGSQVAFSFETDLPRVPVQLDVSTSVYIAAMQIGRSFYAYAVRMQLSPVMRHDGVSWTGSSIVPLMIEELPDNIILGYEKFCQTVTRISDIKNTIIQSIDK